MDTQVGSGLKSDHGKLVRYGPSRLYCPHLDRDDVIETDVLVLGSGAAGLFSAIRAARTSRVVVVSKRELNETNTRYAQGGIAGVLSEVDSFNSHAKDTHNGGYGLNRPDIVEMVVGRGPETVKELVELGARFDRQDSGAFDLAREGGHSERRVLRALGDQTGKEIERALLATVNSHERVKCLENTYAIDLLVDNGVCLGALVMTSDRRFMVVSAKATIIATGGLCQIYRETTNPDTATGDGVALAYRAGARVEDMEFVQFHPTTLYLAGAPRFLITEAARGEGAKLLNSRHERFMPDYHPMAELAPRDVVSRAILHEQERTRSSSVFLDMRHLGTGAHKRFPRISAVLAGFDINIAEDLIPVYPSAHYSIGGVKVNAEARTSVARLFACGEAAATGFHGANRLGSNSLLESAVFGAIAGDNAAATAASVPQPPQPVVLAVCESGEKVDNAYPDIELDIADARISLRSLMWRYVGIERDAEGLEAALAKIKLWARYLIYRRFVTASGWELQNMLMVSRLAVDSALTRTESRGVHFRKDHQQPSDDWLCHIYLER